jgi:hypothetical protein
MWNVGIYERRQCPPEFVDRLVSLGGLNRFGEPNWRVVWGQSETEQVGGTWEVPKPGTHFIVNPKGELVEQQNTMEIAEMREVLKYEGQACWVLERWFPPENYGTEFQWYLENADPKGSGLSILGRYPDEGYYETCQRLITGDGRAVELNDAVLDYYVPMILKTHETTDAQRKAVRTAVREEEERKEHERKVQMYVDAVPDTRVKSFSGQKSKKSWLDKGEEKISRTPWKKGPKSFGQL